MKDGGAAPPAGTGPARIGAPRREPLSTLIVERSGARLGVELPAGEKWAVLSDARIHTVSTRTPQSSRCATHIPLAGQEVAVPRVVSFDLVCPACWGTALWRAKAECLTFFGTRIGGPAS